MTAPAKVNLFLKVLNRRRDSYHNILTLFERLDLADTVKISKIPKGITVKSDKFITRNQQDNIAYKAARLIIRSGRVKSGVRIEIKKRIPIGGGLGGGSSDAAAVLMGMNALFGLRLSGARLMGLAASLGADVPFFILNAPFAVGRARGDALTKAAIGRRFWHLIVYPGFRVSTKEIYGDFALTTPEAGVKITFPLAEFRRFDAAEEALENDLQYISISKYRAINGVIERLAYLLGKRAIVSGSGPSVFCLYKTRKEAAAAARRLLGRVQASERRGWQVFVSGTQI